MLEGVIACCKEVSTKELPEVAWYVASVLFITCRTFPVVIALLANVVDPVNFNNWSVKSFF